MTFHTFETVHDTQGTYEEQRPSRTDMYDIERFRENDNPNAVSLARKIHAVGYLRMGFVEESALTPQGYLRDDIDKARGNDVDYFIGPGHYTQTDITPNVRQIDAVTMRKIHIPPGGTVMDLPAYQVCRSGLYPDDHTFLLGLDNASTRLKEIGALAGTPTSHPTGIYELLRNAIHEAHGRDEVWVASIVSTTYAALSKRLGPDALRQIGTPVPIRSEHVKESVALVPITTNVDGFIGAIYDSLTRETNHQARRRQLESFLFFSEGLRDDELGDELAEARAELLSVQQVAKDQSRG
jgi:hypothetical protein